MKQLVIIFLCLATFNIISAQNFDYTTSGESLRFIDSAPVAVAQEPQKIQQNEEMFLYTAGIRFGLGYSASFPKFDFEKTGIWEGLEARVVDSDLDQGFLWPAPIVNFEFKLGMPKPLHYFSVGIAVDYHIVPIEGMSLEIESLTRRKTKQEDICDVHVISVLAFLEFRYPFKVGDTWMAPYIKCGLGASFPIHDNSDLLDLDGSAFSFMTAIGVEYYLNKDVSVFFEPRWNYTSPGMTFYPYDNNSKFSGDLSLYNLSVMIGVNIYLGVGKTL